MLIGSAQAALGADCASFISPQSNQLHWRHSLYGIAVVRKPDRPNFKWFRLNKCSEFFVLTE